MVGMATAKDAARTYQADYAAVFDAVGRAAVRCGMGVRAADPATGAFTLSTSASLMSWGENLGVQVGQLEPGVIQVAMRSDLKFGLVDWGKNAKNINRFFAALDAELGLAGPLPGVAPAPQQAAPPPPPQQVAPPPPPPLQPTVPPPPVPQQMSPGPRGTMSPAPRFNPGVGMPGPGPGGPAPVAPAAPGPPAGWNPDPAGRHEYRYWDGLAWTDQVSDAGAVSSDPLT